MFGQPRFRHGTNGGENASLYVYSPAFGFSRVSENVFYYFDGSNLEQATIVRGTPMSDTVTSNSRFPFSIVLITAHTQTPTLSDSGFRLWSSRPSSIRRTAGCGPACPAV
jgi:hypothetical protein